MRTIRHAEPAAQDRTTPRTSRNSSRTQANTGPAGSAAMATLTDAESEQEAESRRAPSNLANNHYRYRPLVRSSRDESLQ